MSSIRAGGLTFGRGNPMIVAEISCNHMGSLELAERLVTGAAVAGADAVKFQLYTPSDLTAPVDWPEYTLQSGPWAGRPLWELYDEARTPREWLPGLYELARSAGLIPFCSVFNAEDLPFLEELGTELYKIASAEANMGSLIRDCVDQGKPVLVSDGAFAVNPDYALIVPVRCVAEYPANAQSYGFADMAKYATWGLSDHSTHASVWCAAAAMGASIIEAHLMLGGTMPLDAGHSLTTHEFSQLAHMARQAAYVAHTSRVEWKLPEFSRRLVYARDIPAGTTVRTADVTLLRCSEGVNSMAELYDLPTRKLTTDVSKYQPVRLRDFKGLT